MSDKATRCGGKCADKGYCLHPEYCTAPKNYTCVRCKAGLSPCCVPDCVNNKGVEVSKSRKNQKKNVVSNTALGQSWPDQGDKGYAGFGNKTYSELTSSSLATETEIWSGKKDPVVYEKCADKHPGLTIKEGIVVYGGSASKPVQADCDIYVSLDWGTAHSGKAYPWNVPSGPIFISFPITDMSVPRDIAEFKKMITWLSAQLVAGKKVQVGCIGGHGRTGMVLSALTKEIAGIEDAITFVRKNYCEKAVESSEQVKFLNKHYGIKEVKGYKSGWGNASTSTTGKSGMERVWEAHKGNGNGGGYAKSFNETYVKKPEDSAVAFPVTPFGKRGNIWGL